MKAEKITALAKTEENAVAVYDEAHLTDWGGSEITSKDIIIPSIILLQANSPQIPEGKGKAGEYIDSVSGENFGNELKSLVPFHMEKTWTIEKFNGKKYEWVRTEKMTLDNENDPYEFETHEGKFRRKYTYRFFVMLDGHVLPFSIKFKGASKKYGSNLSTEMFVKNKMKNIPPAALLVSVKAELEKNKDGDTYYVSKTYMGDKTPYEKVMEALNWFKTIRQSDNVVVAGEGKDFDHD